MIGADLVPSLPEMEEDDCPISPRDSILAESQVVGSTELGCEDRVEDHITSLVTIIDL